MIKLSPRAILMHFTALSTSLWYGVGEGVGWKLDIRWPWRMNGHGAR